MHGSHSSQLSPLAASALHGRTPTPRFNLRFMQAILAAFCLATYLAGCSAPLASMPVTRGEQRQSSAAGAIVADAQVSGDVIKSAMPHVDLAGRDLLDAALKPIGDIPVKVGEITAGMQQSHDDAAAAMATQKKSDAAALASVKATADRWQAKDVKDVADGHSWLLHLMWGLLALGVVTFAVGLTLYLWSRLPINEYVAIGGAILSGSSLAVAIVVMTVLSLQPLLVGIVSVLLIVACLALTIAVGYELWVNRAALPQYIEGEISSTTAKVIAALPPATAAKAMAAIPSPQSNAAAIPK
jgi:hypothetical protein